MYGISDEIEFVTIVIYETMTLEIKATIALLFRSSLTMFVCIEGKAICPKVCQLHIQSFCLITCFKPFALFFHRCRLLLCQACQLGL